MTRETANRNIGGYFWAFNRRCKVTTVDSFSGVLHYGFVTVNESENISGWIPAEFVGGTEWTA
jgi:hypothetical protein